MPDGVMQWFDPARGVGVITRDGRTFTVVDADIAPAARRAGARVHFDVESGPGGERAVNVTARRGDRSSSQHSRAGSLMGAHGVDAKGATSFKWTHSRRRAERSSRPTDVMQLWVRCIGAGDVDGALALYASDAQVHAGGATYGGRRHVHAFLESCGLEGALGAAEISGDDRRVAITARGAGPSARTVTVHSRIQHGLIAEQWFGDEGEYTERRETEEEYEFPCSVLTRGHVGQIVVDYAWRRLGLLIDGIAAPVRFVGIKLSRALDPALERPALAEVEIDIDGDLVRAHVAAGELEEAIDLLARRLRDQLEHRAERRIALHRSTGASSPGEWRHGDLSHERPEVFERPVEERQLIRRKTFAIGEMTPDEAAFDMDLLDHDFYLFRDLSTGDDALLERDGSGYRLTRAHPGDLETNALAIKLTVDPRIPPTLTVEEAIEMLEAAHQRFAFFVDAASGRGNVVYRRYDGHYGLIAPQ